MSISECKDANRPGESPDRSFERMSPARDVRAIPLLRLLELGAMASSFALAREAVCLNACRILAGRDHGDERQDHNDDPSHRLTEPPSRRNRARPDGGNPCTTRLTGLGRRQHCRVSSAGRVWISLMTRLHRGIKDIRMSAPRCRRRSRAF